MTTTTQDDDDDDGRSDSLQESSLFPVHSLSAIGVAAAATTPSVTTSLEEEEAVDGIASNTTPMHRRPTTTTIEYMRAAEFGSPASESGIDEEDGGPQRVETESARNVVVEDEEEKQPQRKRRRRAFDYFMLSLGILFWGGIVTMIYFLIAWQRDNDSKNKASPSTNTSRGAPVFNETTMQEAPTIPSPTTSPSIRGGATTVPSPISPATIVPTSAAPISPTVANELFALLSAASFDNGAALNDQSSAQFRAFEWLAANTNLTFYSDERKLARYALATFFYSTGGNDSWLDVDLWLSQDNECDWFSRSRSSPCNTEGAFQDLELSYNNFQGSLPPEIGFLSNSLQTINIGGGPSSKIGGTLPSELGYLSKLQEVRLPNNALTGTLPTEIGDWTDIRTINLSENQLSGELPSEIGVMSDLFYFSAENNAFSGADTDNNRILDQFKDIESFRQCTDLNSNPNRSHPRPRLLEAAG